MAVQRSTSSRNAALDSFESHVGTTPTLELRSGAQPANCAASDSGTLLVSMTLPSDWMAAASGGTKALAGSWSGTASATGTLGHYRIKQGSTCHEQGSVTASGGGGDLIASTTTVASVGQVVSVTSLTWTAGNA